MRTCRLQTFVIRLQTAVNTHNWHSTAAPPSISTVLAAFAAALADQMRPMWAQMVVIEQDLHAGDGKLPGQAQAPVTLLKLEYQLQVC